MVPIEIKLGKKEEIPEQWRTISIVLVVCNCGSDQSIEPHLTARGNSSWWYLLWTPTGHRVDSTLCHIRQPRLLPNFNHVDNMVFGSSVSRG